MSNEAGKLFIISAPSGSGKSTVISEILKQKEDVFFSVSATTRKPRDGEVDGVVYHFISREIFENMIKSNEFLEYAEYVGNFYGTPRRPIEEKMRDGFDVILDIEIQGHHQIKTEMPNSVSIFLVPPSFEELERRLRSRGTDSEEKIRSRLEKATHEMQQMEHYDYVVVSDIAKRSADEIISIMADEHKK